MDWRFITLRTWLWHSSYIKLILLKTHNRNWLYVHRSSFELWPHTGLPEWACSVFYCALPCGRREWRDLRHIWKITIGIRTNQSLGNRVQDNLNSSISEQSESGRSGQSASSVSGQFGSIGIVQFETIINGVIRGSQNLGDQNWGNHSDYTTNALNLAYWGRLENTNFQISKLCNLWWSCLWYQWVSLWYMFMISVNLGMISPEDTT